MPFQVNMQHKLLDGRALPILDYPTKGGRGKERPAQMDADFESTLYFAVYEFVVADFLTNYLWFRLTL